MSEQKNELAVYGKIKSFLPVEGGTSAAGKEWKKQSYIVANNDGYEGAEQEYCFEVFGEEKVEQLASFNKVGDNVKVCFNIKTNQWKDKYFTSLSSWRIEKVEGGSAPVESSNEPDDLPF